MISDPSALLSIQAACLVSLTQRIIWHRACTYHLLVNYGYNKYKLQQSKYIGHTTKTEKHQLNSMYTCDFSDLFKVLTEVVLEERGTFCVPARYPRLPFHSGLSLYVCCKVISLTAHELVSSRNEYTSMTNQTVSFYSTA